MSAFSAALAPRVPVPPRGLSITQVIDGKKVVAGSGSAVALLDRPEHFSPQRRTPKENPMPRGVYDRSKAKKKEKSTPAAKPGRKPRVAAPGKPAGVADLLAQMRRQRGALDTAIRALEAL